jgi:hypothetical protein
MVPRGVLQVEQWRVTSELLLVVGYELVSKAELWV